MSPTIGSGSDRTAMELSAGGGLALLPWTRHLLAALWEQVRLLLQVIYCTFISVFQMFRFEVHLRITDESGQHLQHMEPANSFLFSSLFDGDVVGGSRADGAEALLSGLRADDLDLCRGLVDDLVSRTSGKESGWTVDFRGDWSLFSSSGSDASPQWSSEDDQNQADLEGEESRALWESLSACSDPYNPLFFSASFGTAGPAKVLATRSDSEVSWSGSDSSGLPEESEKLLELFSSADPYDPMCFTASTAPPPRPRSEMAQSDTSRPCTEEKEEEEEEEEEETEEEEDWLWNSFSNCSPPPANTPDQGGSPTDGKRRLSEPNSQHHLCPDRTLVPWKKPGAAGTESEKRKTCSAHKQVRFSPVVQVHVMRSWSFARRAARPGPWEEMARDRERFRRRVQEAERSIGPCLDATHRARIWACRDAPPTAADAPSV